MSKLQKLISTKALLSLGMLLIGAAPPMMAQQTGPDGEPLLVKMNSNIYSYTGPTNTFTIYLGSTDEAGVDFYIESAKESQYVEVFPYSVGTGADGEHSTLATAVSLGVTELDDEIRIYGDPSKLEFLDVHGCYLSTFEITQELPFLSVIDLSHNELEALDLSQQVNLNSIDITDNAFRVPENMNLGTVHPNLVILQVGINDVCDPRLDLRNFPELQYFSARNNYGIYSVDPSQCPNLISLVLEVTNISEIDVSHNLELDVLNLSQTRITNVDLSKNTKLGELYISHQGSFNNEDRYRVHSIDISNNPLIQYLDLSGNALTEIDLSNNNDIRMLYLQHNQLSDIDLSGKNFLSTVNLGYNNFDFATLPLPQEGWDYYYYRAPLPCDFKYKVNEPIDFSSQVIRAPFEMNGETIYPRTYAAVIVAPRAKDEYELDIEKYTFEEGVMTIHEALPDSVYIEFYCDVFPDWPMHSDYFMVKTAEDFDAPNAVFSFKPMASVAGKEVSLSMGATPLASSVSLPADVMITAGGETFSFNGAVTSSSLPSTPNVTFTVPENSGNILVSLPDGIGITALAIDGVAMESIDLSTAEFLSILKLTDCSLSKIDLKYNRALTYLDLENNLFQSLDLTPVRGDYQKYSLATINLASNKLKAFEMTTAETVDNLYLANNQFTDFDLKYYTGLKSLDLSGNLLSETVDLSMLTKPVNIDLSDNSIINVIMPVKASDAEEDPLSDLQTVDLTGNRLTLATLPRFDEKVSYAYAPQQKMAVLSPAPAINLENQNVGFGTTFVWKYADNGAIVPSTELTCTDGATIFNESLVGSTVYCEMTNDWYPAFNDSPLTTTDVVVADKPNNLVASFTTLNDGTADIGFLFNSSGDNAVYIDWRGDGSEYEPYIYDFTSGSTGIYRKGTTYAGANVKVWSYNPAEDISVFALNNCLLKDFDGTPMTAITAVDIHNAGLTDGSIKLPNSPSLYELVLDGNKFKTEDFSFLKGVSNLNLASNAYESFDLSKYPRVSFVQIASNELKELKLGANDFIWFLDATDNHISEIDLTGMESLQELILADNELNNIDLSPVSETLRALSLAGNYFTFATLPFPTDIGPNLNVMYYANQHPMTVEYIDGQIDLSAQAYVKGNPTEYLWFLGDRQSDVYYDYEEETFMGEMLEGPDVSSDPEYIIENGVTTFLYPQTRKVICAMTNSELPNLILYTTPTSIAEDGIRQVLGEGSDNGLVDVYTIGGMLVKRQADPLDAVKDLNPGLYIVNGKKVLVK